MIYGATADGTRKFLSWLHMLYEKGLIDFENMQNRMINPFGELTAVACAQGDTGYMFSQPALRRQLLGDGRFGLRRPGLQLVAGARTWGRPPDRRSPSLKR